MRIRVSAVVLPILAGLAVTGWAQGQADGVKAVLELRGNFFYAGDPFTVRVNIVNDGDKTTSNPVKTPIYRGLEVRVAGGAVLEPSGKPKASEPSRPDKLGSKGFYGTVVDLVEIYPELAKPGRFQLVWSADGISSDTISFSIIPKYDPTRDYRATVETEEGAFSIDFHRNNAPLATKAFIDLANAGFYDGLLFHEVRPEWYVGGGDPSGDGTGGAPIRYPAEGTSIPVVAGTVLMKPAGVAPPANSSQFVIVLRPETSWTGQFTVFGQVVDGLEVVKRISRLPSSQQATQPFFKPLKDVHTLKISIREKPAPPSPESARP